MNAGRSGADLSGKSGSEKDAGDKKWYSDKKGDSDKILDFLCKMQPRCNLTITHRTFRVLYVSDVPSIG